MAVTFGRGSALREVLRFGRTPSAARAGRIRRSWFTLASLVVAVAVSGFLVPAEGVGGASAPIAQSPEAWHQGVSRLHVPSKGCYHAIYPAVAWQATACTVAPTVPYLPAPSKGRAGAPVPTSVGDGADYAAGVTGLIAKATGSFANMSPGITEKGQFDGSGPQLADTYSLQLNSNFFSSSPACSGISGCLAWQQFVFDSYNSVAFMQYWLIGYLGGASACPSGWYTYNPDCYTNSNAVLVSPSVTAAQLASTAFSGSAVSGGNDTATLTVGTQAFAVSNTDSEVSLASAWDQTEWGVFGDAGGGVANFGANTTLEAETTLASNSGAAPTCEANAGTTAETNNLTLSNTPALGSSTSGMIGSLQTNASPGTASCASVAPTNVPSTTVVSGAAQAYPGPHQYTAIVTPTNPPTLYPPIGGTVSFDDGGSAISGCQHIALGSGGKAVCTADLAIGSHSVTATYSGNTIYLASTSQALVQSIVGYPTTTVVGAAVRGSASTKEDITATITSSQASVGNPLGTGTVSFHVNGAALPRCQNIGAGGVTVAVATCVGKLPAGSDTVTATFAGNGTFASSTSPGVSQLVTGVAVTSNHNPASPVTRVTYTATVTETDGGGNVSFRDGGTAIAGCQTLSLTTSDTATCTTAAGAMGSHSITARYSGDTVVPAATSPAFTQDVFGVSSATAPPALSHSPFTVVFDEPVTGVSTADFTVNEAGSTAGLAGTVSCTDASDAGVNCATGPVSQTSLTPNKPLIAGEYYFVSVDSAAGVIETTGGVPVPATVVFVRAQTQFSHSQYPVTYTWATVKQAAALGGSYVEEQSEGGQETFTATGTSVGIVTWDAPNGGTATVSVTNGRTHVNQTIDTHATSAGDQTTTISGLHDIVHTVTISVNGAHDASSSGDWVRIDGTVVGGVTYDTPELTAKWPVLGTTAAYTKVKGASVSLTFRGTGVVWTAYAGPAEGHASVSIDGGTPVTEDLYAATYGPKTITFSGLSQKGFHTIEITALGTKDPSAGDAFTTVEGFTLR